MYTMAPGLGDLGGGEGNVKAGASSGLPGVLYGVLGDKGVEGRGYAKESLSTLLWPSSTTNGFELSVWSVDIYRAVTWAFGRSLRCERAIAGETRISRGSRAGLS